MNDNKQLILDKLLLALQETSCCRHLVELKLDPAEEIVTAKYENGYTKPVYVKNEPGMTMIRSVIDAIG